MCHSLQEKEKEAASVWCGPRSLEQNENSSQKLANFCPFGLEVSKSNKQKVERRWSWAGPGLVETQTDALFAFLLPGSRHTPGTPPTHTPRGQQGHCQPPFSCGRLQSSLFGAFKNSATIQFSAAVEPRVSPGQPLPGSLQLPHS